MGTTYRFISDPGEPSEVLGWFRSLPAPPNEVSSEHGVTLYFKDVGPLSFAPDGSFDPKGSPVATVLLPQVRRGVLWTVGEVQFLPTPIRTLFPELHKVSSTFSKWLRGFECIYSNEKSENLFAYHLEGTVKNFDSPIYAFQTGLRALQSGRYFVGGNDNSHMLETLCRALKLRGTVCAGA